MYSSSIWCWAGSVQWASQNLLSTAAQNEVAESIVVWARKPKQHLKEAKGFYNGTRGQSYVTQSYLIIVNIKVLISALT